MYPLNGWVQYHMYLKLTNSIPRDTSDPTANKIAVHVLLFVKLSQNQLTSQYCTPPSRFLGLCFAWRDSTCIFCLCIWGLLKWKTKSKYWKFWWHEFELQFREVESCLRSHQFNLTDTVSYLGSQIPLSLMSTAIN